MSKVSFTGPKKKDQTSNPAVEKEPLLHLSGSDRYKEPGQRSLGSVEKFIREHPTLGEGWENYLSFSQDYGTGMMKSLRLILYREIVPPQPSIVMDHFVLVEYDGEPLFKDVTVDYEVVNLVIETQYGCSHSIKITKEQKRNMKSMNDSSKKQMSFNDFRI